MTGPVNFFGNKHLFSNFAPTPVVIDGLEYATTEHYFQAMKFAKNDPKYAEEVRKSPTPGGAKKLGKSRQHPIDEDWNDQRDDVMRVALLNKALQNPQFVKDLLASGDREIIEASPWDYYWGTGAKKTGKNMLGKLLVELRTKLKRCASTMYISD